MTLARPSDSCDCGFPQIPPGTAHRTTCPDFRALPPLEPLPSNPCKHWLSKPGQGIATVSEPYVCPYCEIDRQFDEIERLQTSLTDAQKWRDYYRAQWLGPQAVPPRAGTSKSTHEQCTCGESMAKWGDDLCRCKQPNAPETEAQVCPTCKGHYFPEKGGKPCQAGWPIAGPPPEGWPKGVFVPSEKAFVQLCAPHGKDWLTCPECAKAADKMAVKEREGKL